MNSVLDWGLPLHAASSDGNKMEVKLLVEQEADVNAAIAKSEPSSWVIMTFIS
jgi:hypothetical protein